MKPRTKKIAWLFDRLNKAGRFSVQTQNGYTSEVWAPWGLSVGDFYDRDLELLQDFMDEFPGRKSNDYKNGKNRLSRLLNEMVKDNWIDRTIRGNQIEYIGEGQRWAYVYSMPTVFARNILEGKTTPEQMAREYCGDHS